MALYRRPEGHATVQNPVKAMMYDYWMGRPFICIREAHLAR